MSPRDEPCAKLFSGRNTQSLIGTVGRDTGRGLAHVLVRPEICSCASKRSGSRMHHIDAHSGRPREQRVGWWGTVIALSCVPVCAQAAWAYVSNEDGESVSVIDIERAEAIATIPVGKRPRGLKLNRNGSLLYVAVSGLPKCPPSVPDAECAKLKRDLQADGVAVIDTATLKLTRLLKGGSDPEQFDLSGDGRRLF